METYCDFLKYDIYIYINIELSLGWEVIDIKEVIDTYVRQKLKPFTYSISLSYKI